MGSSASGLESTDELRSRVALMRELGVLRWGDVLLGPPPPPPPVADATPADPNANPEFERKRAQYEQLLNRQVTDEEMKRYP